MILVFGQHGQLASSLQHYLPPSDTVCYVGQDEVDFMDPAQLEDCLAQLSPSCIINTSAYTKVDQAEDEPDIAYALNTKAPEIMARYAKMHDALLIHFSTDYVFDGNNPAPYTEEDKTSPLSIYGRSKAKGEKHITASECKHFIFRVTWLYDHSHPNFFTTMLRLFNERPILQIVDDQIGAPCYVDDLAKSIADHLPHLQNSNSYGIYHLTHKGSTSWHGFASSIHEHIKHARQDIITQTIEAITSKEYPTKATRPKNSVLDNTLAKRTLDLSLPNWEDGLRRCFNTWLESQH